MSTEGPRIPFLEPPLLGPCPVCGVSEWLVQDGDMLMRDLVHCKRCGARVPRSQVIELRRSS
jgi:hypothetical protein